ncbi:MAG TPA: TM0106 family RecB-like putative nuclease, partial [Limnobacter sp.]|nr:TM0106 family RecB-like putative nuclease [Limnobacter sp.]
LPVNVKGMQPGTLARLVEQARLQVHEKETGEQQFRLLTPEDDSKGFNRLPPPNEGDLFFDMEGDPMYPDGLEYLFGVYYRDAGEARFKAFWAHSREEEGKAFSGFMDFVNQRLDQFPDAHIYHYASYEKTALKRLMSLHGRHEESVDRLLREHRMVDLYRVVREGLRISKTSYSIKQVEQFYSSARTVDVTNAAESIVVYERWRQQQDSVLLKSIEDYNHDDCRSTWELREWLLRLRPPTARWFSRNAVAHNKPKTDRQLARQAEQAEKQAAHEAWLKSLEQRIHQSPHLQSRPASYRHLLLQIVDFHKRAAKPAWWALFERAEAETEELMDDMEVIADMQFMGQLENGRIPKVSKWKYPEQEFKCKEGDPVVLLNVEGMIPGSIERIDEDNCELVLKSSQLALMDFPKGKRLHVSAGQPISTEIIADAVKDFVECEIQGLCAKSAVRQFLLREPPRFVNRKVGDALLRSEAECSVDKLQQVKELIAGMQHSCLFIQGPPGTGKTYTGSHVIAHLIQLGKKVAIASNSHKAINNLVEKTAAVLEKANHRFEGIKIGRKDEHAVEGFCLTTCLKKDVVDDAPLSRGEAPDLLAGTAWLFSDPKLKDCFDYLFIDEAGQVATANTVGMGQCADNIVLLGDQMQLGQPIQGDHPGESGLSTLEYLLGHKATIEPHRGVFLDQTFRMHPAVCSYISDTFYEGRLGAADRTHQQGLVLHGRLAELFSATGVYCLPVVHDGNSQRSQEEAQEIARLYEELLEQKYVDHDGKTCRMCNEEILVVAPYNAQVNLLKRMLPEGARVGTVDRFQGQEAQAVLVSMTTSNEQHMPRHLDFLFSRNRLNVAISRAKSIAVVVMSPALADVSSDRPDTLGLINTFIGLVSRGS